MIGCKTQTPCKGYEGVYHFTNALSKGLKEDLLDVYMLYKDGLYVPKLKSGHNMNLKMFCLGKHWSAIDYKYHDARVDIDNAAIGSLPKLLNSIAATFADIAFPYYNPSWDICIINYYGKDSTLGVHQDNSESKEALDIGHPVVSFSIGAPCNFKMGGITRDSEYKTSILDEGDVFIFGGPSRLRYHGVTKVLPTNSSFEELDGGRVNFTLRKY